MGAGVDPAARRGGHRYGPMVRLGAQPASPYRPRAAPTAGSRLGLPGGTAAGRLRHWDGATSISEGSRQASGLGGRRP